MSDDRLDKWTQEAIAAFLEDISEETAELVKAEVSVMVKQLDAGMRRIRDLGKPGAAGLAAICVVIGLGHRLRGWDGEDRLRFLRTFAESVGASVAPAGEDGARATLDADETPAATPWRRRPPHRPGRRYRH